MGERQFTAAGGEVAGTRVFDAPGLSMVLERLLADPELSSRDRFRQALAVAAGRSAHYPVPALGALETEIWSDGSGGFVLWSVWRDRTDADGYVQSIGPDARLAARAALEGLDRIACVVRTGLVPSRTVGFHPGGGFYVDRWGKLVCPEGTDRTPLFRELCEKGRGMIDRVGEAVREAPRTGAFAPFHTLMGLAARSALERRFRYLAAAFLDLDDRTPEGALPTMKGENNAWKSARDRGRFFHVSGRPAPSLWVEAVPAPVFGHASLELRVQEPLRLAARSAPEEPAGMPGSVEGKRLWMGPMPEPEGGWPKAPRQEAEDLAWGDYMASGLAERIMAPLRENGTFERLDAQRAMQALGGSGLEMPWL